MTEAKLEETLDRDFLYFLSQSKTYYSQVVDEKDKTLCTQWLAKLCSEKVEGISEKRNRNIYLSQLIINMQEGRLLEPFLKSPDDRALPSAIEVFDLQNPGEIFTSQTADDTGEMPDDFQERSADGRTYVAIRCLPNNQGTYAFVALTIDKEDTDETDVAIVPCTADKSKLHYVKALHKLSTSTILDNNPSEAQMEDFYIKTIEAKVSGDISQLYKSLNAQEGKPCGRHKNEIAFYDLLLQQIDEEIKGITSEDNDLVRFLVSRLAQDLRKEPKMKHLFSMSSEQRHLKLLEILRQKLIARQQEEKRRNILAEMEEHMLASSINPKCCMNRSDEPTEFMWQLAVTKPLSDSDLERLYQVYPEEAISTFLDLLAEDRQSILDKGRARQNNLMDSMRAEVYKEVQSGKAEYNKARAAYREWNEILSTVEEMMYEANNEIMEDNEIPRQREAILMNMISNIKETENLVIAEARRGEMLTEKIVNTNTWTFLTENSKEKDESWKIKSAIESIRREIETYRVLINKQTQRIKELREQLSYS